MKRKIRNVVMKVCMYAKDKAHTGNKERQEAEMTAVTWVVK